MPRNSSWIQREVMPHWHVKCLSFRVQIPVAAAFARLATVSHPKSQKCERLHFCADVPVQINEVRKTSLHLNEYRSN